MAGYLVFLKNADLLRKSMELLKLELRCDLKKTDGSI